MGSTHLILVSSSSPPFPCQSALQQCPLLRLTILPTYYRSRRLGHWRQCGSKVTSSRYCRSCCQCHFHRRGSSTYLPISPYVETTQHSLPLVLIRPSHWYMKAFPIHRYPSSLDIIKNIISSDKSYYSSNYISRYY